MEDRKIVARILTNNHSEDGQQYRSELSQSIIN